MTANVQQSPYLRQQRNFPNDNMQALTVEIDKAYIDIATTVNTREIGTYAVNTQTVTGQQWFLKGQPNRQQTLRQVYPITSYAPFPHNINLATVSMFTTIRGVVFEGTINYLPIPYVSAGGPASNIGIQINGPNVLFTLGTSPPAIVNGIVILEWLSQF